MFSMRQEEEIAETFPACQQAPNTCYNWLSVQLISA